MIINVVYFAAWLFKYFQTDYRLLQGIIGRPQTIAFFHPDSIPLRLRKEGDLKWMPTVNSWLVPLQTLLKLTGHCANHCISNIPCFGCGHSVSCSERMSHKWYHYKCLCLKLSVAQHNDTQTHTHTVNPEIFFRVIVTLWGLNSESADLLWLQTEAGSFSGM